MKKPIKRKLLPLTTGMAPPLSKKFALLTTSPLKPPRKVPRFPELVEIEGYRELFHDIMSNLHDVYLDDPTARVNQREWVEAEEKAGRDPYASICPYCEIEI